MSDITERLRAPRCGLSMFASAADRDMYNVATREEAADEIDRLRAELTACTDALTGVLATRRAVEHELAEALRQLDEARRQLKEASEQEPVVCVAVSVAIDAAHIAAKGQYQAAIHHLNRYAHQSYTRAPVPQPAVPVDDICNAYESGVGHNGRATANVNPYPPGTPQHTAYELGAKGTKQNAPAVPEAVRKLIEQLLSDYESATDEEYSGTSYYAGRVEFQNRARAILSATDSEVKK